MKLKHQDLLAIGRVVKAFGIRGEIVVQPMTPSPARFKKLRAVYLGKVPNEARAAVIDRIQVGPRGVRMSVAGVADRTAAELVVGELVFVDDEQKIEPPRGSYFVYDVLGMSVEDRDGRIYGTVKDILKMPAHDVYVVERSGTEFMIPAVKEFIIDIDVQSRCMKVKLIEGMVEE